MISGTCIETGFSESYGNFVKIKISDSSYISYNHLNKIFVNNGDEILLGEPIALSGNTGSSTAPHLHLSIYTNDVPKDLLSFVKYNYTENFVNEFTDRGEVFVYEN